jgi:hypothetical protein
MFTLDSVVPWGRSFDEYRRMFALTGDDLQLKILGCGDGPASFNAEAARSGSRVVSCDPLYRFETQQIRDRIARTYDEVLEQTRRNSHDFLWTEIASVEELGQVRMSAMTDFLDDFDRGRAEGRYVDAELPSLPFGDHAFDLALCSHFLFLYTTHLGETFHHESIRELCRVATEVRIFPLVALGAGRSPVVEPAVERLRAGGFTVSIEQVRYEFRKGANEVLKIRGSS